MSEVKLGDIALDDALIYDWHPRDLTTVLADEIASGQTVYDALHDRNTNNDYTGLRIGDYIEVPFSDPASAVVSVTSKRFLLADVNPYYQCGDTANARHMVFMADTPVAVASSHPGAVNTSYLQWNTTDTNNGTSTESSPYLASNLKTWETNFYGVLPNELQQYLIDARVLLETRYNSSSALTESTGWKWANLGKVFSLSEKEVWGCHEWSQQGYGGGIDRQMRIFRVCPGNVLNGSRCAWWLRSPRSGSSSSVCIVRGYGYADCYAAALVWVRPRPCFLLG